MLLEVKRKINVAFDKCHNDAAMKNFKSHVSTARTNFIDYRLHHVKESFHSRYELRKVKLEDNVVIMFTKSLGKYYFITC